MIVVIETVLAEVGDVDVGPSIVVVVGDRNANAPSFVGDAGLCGDVGEGAVVVVVKQRSFGSGSLSSQGIDG